MKKKADLWIQETREDNGAATISSVLEIPGDDRRQLWVRIPSGYKPAVSRTADPFVVAALFLAMRNAADLHVHGTVSPSLLSNLEEFQAAWNAWLPAKYTQCVITADEEREQPAAGNGAVVAFSGGVDSCFSAWRHRTRDCGRLATAVKAGVMVHGFDIPLEEEGMFAIAAERSGKILRSLDMELIPVATNLGRELRKCWGDAHGAAIASCLMLLQSGYSAGIIASTEPYTSMVFPWGSNPVTDRFLSSGSFRIIHDAAAFTRSQKIRKIAHHPEIKQHLRVCWEGAEKDRNCGHCEKCVRTVLNFRVSGAGLPGCFEKDVTDKQILALRGLNPVQLAYLEEILAAARDASMNGSWVRALDQCIRKNRRNAKGNQILFYRLRKTLAFRRRLNTLKNALRAT